MKLVWALCVFAIVGATCFLLRYTTIKPKPATSPSKESVSAMTSGANSGANSEVEEPRNQVLDIRISFGYKDARPARFVGDRNERLYVIDYLLAACKQGQFACGFLRDDSDSDLFTKTVTQLNGTIKHVELRITESSVGPDDVSNQKDPFQKWQSAHSEENFLSGLKKADLVLYIGHSRDGGGPNFEPPRILSNNHVNYGWYIRNRPGAKSMLAALKSTSRPPKVIGLLSCYSERHFVKAIHEVAPSVKMVTNDKLLYFVEALDEAKSVVDSFLRDTANETALSQRQSKAYDISQQDSIPSSVRSGRQAQSHL